MFCPEDGSHIPYRADRDFGGAVYYGPCRGCGTMYAYVDGHYEDVTAAQVNAAVNEAQAAERAQDREQEAIWEVPPRGSRLSDASIAHALDVLEYAARTEGHARVTHGLHIEATISGLTYRTHLNNNWRIVSRHEAIAFLLRHGGGRL